MNSQFKTKLIQHLSPKKANKGFTLIELLVVFIIMGVLAVIALPNFLSQVAKASASEAQSQIGAVNRAQQGYFTENSKFTSDDDLLGVPLPEKGKTSKYYTFTLGDGGNLGSITAVNDNRNKYGTRDYAGGTSYNEADRAFASIACRANKDVVGAFSLLANTNVQTTAGTHIQCTGNSRAVK